MKLIIAVVQESDVDEIVSALFVEDYRVTIVTSSGGFLREENATLLIGVESHQVEHVVKIVGEHSTARRFFVNPLMPISGISGNGNGDDGPSVRVGASVFILNVSRFVRMTM